jgi:hypothetical protein
VERAWRHRGQHYATATARLGQWALCS